MNPKFKSEKGKKEILQLYDEKLESLGIAYEYKPIRTSLGTTNIIVTGAPENPPIILVHGSNGCAPISLETYSNLHKFYRVYAVDVLAQPNKSAGTRLGGDCRLESGTTTYGTGKQNYKPGPPLSGRREKPLDRVDGSVLGQ